MVSFLPLSIGNNAQPALFFANMTAQAILGAPFVWRWNRNTINFLCTSGTQDYLNASIRANSSAVSVGTTIIDGNGNGQKVITAGTTAGSAPTWNQNLFGSTTDGTAVWQNTGPLSAIPTINDLGWIEKSAIQDINASPAKWYEMETKLSLEHDSSQSRPRFISAQTDDGAGDIKLRLMSVPNAVYPVSVTYQKKQALFTSLNNTWSPIPDEFFYIVSWGFLSLAFLFADDPRFVMANQKFVTHLLGAAEGLTQTEVNIFLANWNSITNTVGANAGQLNQGIQARAI
jgi:hypothetical protein